MLGLSSCRLAGYNYFGQLGLGDTVSRTHFTPVPGLRGRRIVAVSSGDHHCAAVSATGRLYLWGRGDCGQLGMGDNRRARCPGHGAGLPAPSAAAVHQWPGLRIVSDARARLACAEGSSEMQSRRPQEPEPAPPACRVQESSTPTSRCAGCRRRQPTCRTSRARAHPTPAEPPHQ